MQEPTKYQPLQPEDRVTMASLRQQSRSMWALARMLRLCLDHRPEVSAQHAGRAALCLVGFQWRGQQWGDFYDVTDNCPAFVVDTQINSQREDGVDHIQVGDFRGWPIDRR